MQLKNGKADLVLTLKELSTLLLPSQTIDALSWRTLYVEANVTETLTGITLKGENTVSFKAHVYYLEFLPSSPSNFKPGLSYETHVSIILNFFYISLEKIKLNNEITVKFEVY